MCDCNRECATVFNRNGHMHGSAIIIHIYYYELASTGTQHIKKKRDLESLNGRPIWPSMLHGSEFFNLKEIE